MANFARLAARTAALVAPVCLMAASVAPAGAVVADAASAGPLAGDWLGHGRTLTISKAGLAKEHISDGCCTSVIDMRFKVTHPRGSASKASAVARVTAVHIHAPEDFRGPYGIPKPHVGERKRLRLRNGIVTEPFTGTTFCSMKIQSGGGSPCGA